MNATLTKPAKRRWLRPTLRANTLLLIVAAFLLLFANNRFWTVIGGIAPHGAAAHALFIASIGVLLLFTVLLVLVLGSFKPLLKPWLALVVVLAASGAFFMDGYGAVIDRNTLRNVFETNTREGLEWVNLTMLLKIGLLGILPAAWILGTRVQWHTPGRELWARCKLALGLLLALGVVVGVSGRGIASSLRNHRELGHLANPLAIASALGSYIQHARPEKPIVVAPLGRDAKRLASTTKPRVLVVVVGESARAASWSLSGYARPTNPELAQLPVINFSNVSSCGTDTAVSLPCMFSHLGRKDFSNRGAASSENALDILAHAGYAVTWYDNNTGSKGIAKRLTEHELQDGTQPPFCSKIGCFDAMLVDELTKALPKIQGDSVIVLHTKGSHGPAYYERVPPEFARFKPFCTTSELQKCSQEQIANAYDNTILYTDHIVASAIRALQADTRIDSALLYVSDHGESTGENGLYLHGAPYAIAPKVQTQVPMVLWVGDGYAQGIGLDTACLARQHAQAWSHDNVFDTLLGLGAVTTSAQRPALDITHACRKAPVTP